MELVMVIGIPFEPPAPPLQGMGVATELIVRSADPARLAAEAKAGRPRRLDALLPGMPGGMAYPGLAVLDGVMALEAPGFPVALGLAFRAVALPGALGELSAAEGRGIPGILVTLRDLMEGVFRPVGAAAVLLQPGPALREALAALRQLAPLSGEAWIRGAAEAHRDGLARGIPAPAWLLPTGALRQGHPVAALAATEPVAVPA